MSKKPAETPMMKQYNAVKNQHPDAILLFRVGDFYETFSEDAIKASKVLNITLTKRANGKAASVELAGFPHHALDTYLPKLVRAGYRVAVCDQLEDPKKTKTTVKRGLTELVTPGVSYNDTTYDNKENNFVASVHFGKASIGVSLLDISTGEFLVAEGTADYIDKLMSSFSPKEILYERNKKEKFEAIFKKNYCSFPLEDWVFSPEAAQERLQKQYEVATLKGFGVDALEEGVIAAGAILHYLDLTKHNRTAHITHLRRIEENRFVWLDKFTISNLELYQTTSGEGKALLSILDETQTPMGARLLRRWLAFPLKDVKTIETRQAIINYNFRDPEFKQFLQKKLTLVGDLERLASKVSVGRINPRELVRLRIALSALESIKQACASSACDEIFELSEQLSTCEPIRKRLEHEIKDEPPLLINRGGVFAEGVNEGLDEYRRLAFSGKDYLLKIQERESEQTGIPSLKIAYNNVFGYYLEVRNGHKDKVPESWFRKQTLANAERYVTEELKEYEGKILGAQDKINEIEGELYLALLRDLSAEVLKLQLNAAVLAQLDVLLSFALVAEKHNYVCPKVIDSDVLDIKQGRHPVIETQLPVGEEYIANDVFLDRKQQQVMMITGPNMSGKSALLRQTALIVLLAQIGSFVPAQAASIGLVDKIFTRVGASDNISMGESTFMVEMNEAASILNNLSARSLVLFDELGRGTSTYDGISIAWAIVEHIHESKNNARTLFATHYHELNEMEASFSRIKNYNVSIKETKDKVIFLRKLARGGSEHSFGIHVAKMAGMPKSIVKRAGLILNQLEGEQEASNVGELSKAIKGVADTREAYQMSLFQLDDPVLSQVRDEILDVDLNNLTPLDALNKLSDIKRILKGK